MLKPWLEIARWLPVDAPLKGFRPWGPGQLLAIVAQFDVAHAKRYQPGDGKTYCNIFTWDATRALGVEIPHWVNPAGDAVPPGKGAELSANLTMDWLKVHGPRRGWVKCSREQAAEFAELGQPTVAVWQNPQPKHSGHIALLVPTLEHGHIHVAQAGARCFSSDRLERGFGPAIPLFFTRP